MKTLLLLCMLVLGGAANAQEQSSAGYINLDSRGEAYFISVNVQKQELTSTLPMGMFNKGQQNLMSACMNLKETNTIVVTLVAATQNNVPTGIPGRTTSTHFPVVSSVECVKATGFLNQWRNIVRNSKFH